MNPVTDLLNSLHEKGVTLWAENGSVRHAAPPHALTTQDLHNIETYHTDIVDFYEHRSLVADTAPLTRFPCEPVPATFQQTWYWEVLERCKWKYVFIGCAFRLIGPLDIEALRASIETVVRRHEALRTRIEIKSGVIMQRIDPPDTCRGYELEVVTLNGQRGEVEAEARRCSRQFISDPPDWDTGPVFRVRLLKLAAHDHVLLVTVDHMVADGFSNGLVNREIFVSYVALSQDNRGPMPQVSLQYPDYAVWQHRTAASWDSRHGAYWRERLVGAERVRWPADEHIDKGAPPRAAMIQMKIDAALTNQLREFAKRQDTTLPRVTLAIYAALLARTCNTRDIVIPFLSMGRNHSKFAAVVGFLAHYLFLRIQLPENATLLDLLGLTQRELNAAMEHADFGRIASEKPELFTGSAFQWAPWTTSFIEQASTSNANPIAGKKAKKNSLKVSRFTIDPMNLRDEEGLVFQDPSFSFSESPKGIGGACSYRTDRFKQSSLERVGRNLRLLAKSYVESPTMLVSECLLEIA